MTNDPLTTMATHVAELTEQNQHVEPTRRWSVTVNPKTGRESVNDELTWHRSTHPSLLTALRATIVDQSQTAAMAVMGPARNVPRLNVDALDRMQRIRQTAREWAKAFGKDPAAGLVDQLNRQADELAKVFPATMRPAGVDRAIDALSRVATQLPTTADWDVRVMVGIAASADDESRRMIGRDVARWRTWCRIFAGWEVTPWRPNARCPSCGALAGVIDDIPSGLRVRLDVKSAVCLSCDATWGDPPLPAIDGLAEHIHNAEKSTNSTALIECARIPEPGPYNRGGRA
jgi:hypothetical protein